MLRCCAEREAVGARRSAATRGARGTRSRRRSRARGACACEIARCVATPSALARVARASRARRCSRSRARAATAMPCSSASAAPHLLEHRRARAGGAVALHDRRPDRARVVDVDVDLAGAQRVEARPSSRATARAATRSARLAASRRPEDLGQHVLLGEGLRADRDRALAAPAARQAHAARPRVEQASAARRERRPRAPPPRADAALEQRGSAASSASASAAAATQPTSTAASLRVCEPAEDEVAEAGRADRRRERRGADDPDGGRAHARDDHRQRERQLDAQQRWRGVMPTARAASRSAGIDAARPATVLRRIGSMP